MIIIGITGTLGAGKGTIADFLVKKRGFSHYSVREFLIREIEKRELPVNRPSMTIVGNDLRTRYGSGYIAEELYKEAVASGKNCIIESIRTEGEIIVLKKHKNFYLFAVDADQRTRYQRVVARQSETDQISYEEFGANEKREFASDDPSKQNLSRCITLADYVFHNDGTREELEKQVNAVLEKVFRTIQ